MAATLTGLLPGLAHAILSIKYVTNLILSGTVVNIFAGDITVFISASFIQEDPALNYPGIFKPIKIPQLSTKYYAVQRVFMGAVHKTRFRTDPPASQHKLQSVSNPAI